MALLSRQCLIGDFDFEHTYPILGNRNAALRHFARRAVPKRSRSGNVLTKTNISTSESVEYTWDHRNRLVKVTFKNSGGTPTEIVEYAYDYGQRWVRKTLDTNADQTIEESRVFVHDNGQIVLDFQKTGTGSASNSDLAHRYLWGNSVDQLLVDETVDDGTADDAAWALTDHLNSVRDLVVFNPGTETVSVQKHLAYDAFGIEQSSSGVIHYLKRLRVVESCAECHAPFNTDGMGPWRVSPGNIDGTMISLQITIEETATASK